MSLSNPTEIEQAWADFIKHSNAEARECLNARRRAKAARRLVRRPTPLPRGPAHFFKIDMRSRLVYGPGPYP